MTNDQTIFFLRGFLKDKTTLNEEQLKEVKKLLEDSQTQLTLHSPYIGIGTGVKTNTTEINPPFRPTCTHDQKYGPGSRDLTTAPNLNPSWDWNSRTDKPLPNLELSSTAISELSKKITEDLKVEGALTYLDRGIREVEGKEFLADEIQLRGFVITPPAPTPEELTYDEVRNYFYKFGKPELVRKEETHYVAFWEGLSKEQIEYCEGCALKFKAFHKIQEVIKPKVDAPDYVSLRFSVELPLTNARAPLMVNAETQNDTAEDFLFSKKDSPPLFDLGKHNRNMQD